MKDCTEPHLLDTQITGLRETVDVVHATLIGASPTLSIDVLCVLEGDCVLAAYALHMAK